MAYSTLDLGGMLIRLNSDVGGWEYTTDQGRTWIPMVVPDGAITMAKLAGNAVSGRSFKTRRTANQSIANAAAENLWTGIIWDTAVVGAPEFRFGNPPQTKIAAPWLGLYLISATVTFATNPTGQRGIRISRDAIGAGENNNAASVLVNASAAGATVLTLSTLVPLTVAANLSIDVYQNSGAAMNFIDDPSVAPPSHCKVTGIYLGS